MALAPQASTLRQIFLSAQARVILQTELDESKVYPTIMHEPFADCLERHITIQFQIPDPDSFGGAGRLSTRVKRNMFITIWTRLALDQIKRNAIWLYDEVFGHYLVEDQVLDGFHDLFLFDVDDSTRKVTILPLHWVPGQLPANIPQRPKDFSWGSSVLCFSVEYVQALSTGLVVPTT